VTGDSYQSPEQSWLNLLLSELQTIALESHALLMAADESLSLFSQPRPLLLSRRSSAVSLDHDGKRR
jgi:hypothetical protein